MPGFPLCNTDVSVEWKLKKVATLRDYEKYII